MRLADAAATESLGRALASSLSRGCRDAPVMVHLEGPLGAGKTTLVRGLLRGLGHEGRVRSPTFTLLEPYDLPSCQVVHLDLYRLSDPGELEYLGLLDLLVPGSVALVEWAERGGDRLPAPDLRIRLEYDGTARRAAWEALSPRGRGLIAAVAWPPEAPPANKKASQV